MMDPGLIVFVVAVLVLAGMVKGVIAMGMPTIGVGLLSIVMPPADAAALIILPSALTNVAQLLAGPRLGPLVRRFWVLAATVTAGTLLGGMWLGGLESRIAPAMLGCTLLLYGILGLRQLHFVTPASWEAWLSPVMGLASGLLTGTTGVTVMPVAPFLQSLSLERDDLIQALGLVFTVATFALAAALSGRGAPFSDPRMVAASVAALIPAFVGMEVGRRVRQRISPAAFKTWFFAGLALLGTYMVLRPILF